MNNWRTNLIYPIFQLPGPRQPTAITGAAPSKCFKCYKNYSTLSIFLFFTINQYLTSYMFASETYTGLEKHFVSLLTYFRITYLIIPLRCFILKHIRF